MTDFKMTEALLHYSEKSPLSARGEWLDLMHDIGVYSGGVIMPAVEAIKLVCKSNKSNTDKIFMLEAIECDFTLVAEHMGFDLRGIK